MVLSRKIRSREAMAECVEWLTGQGGDDRYMLHVIDYHGGYTVIMFEKPERAFEFKIRWM